MVAREKFLPMLLGITLCLALIGLDSVPIYSAAAPPPAPAGTTPSGADLSAADATDIVAGSVHWVDQGYNPQWTADGSYIVFCREDDGFFAMTPTCEDVRQIGKDLYFEGLAPDGKTAYGSHPEKGLFAVDIATGKAKLLTSTPCGRCNWSPDGKYALVGLGFKKYDYGDRVKWICEPDQWALMATDGSKLNPLNFKGIKYWRISWSPDGKKLIVDTDEGPYIMNANGTGKVLVKNLGGWVGATTKIWTRDGNNIRIANSDGSGAKVIAKVGNLISFSPSGAWMIFKEPNSDEGDPAFILRIADEKKFSIPCRDYPELLWYPGEKCLIYYNQKNEPILKNLEDPAKDKRLCPLGYRWEDIQLSPSAKMLAFRYEARLGLTNTDGAKAHLISPADFDVWQYLWSPRGNSLVCTEGRNIVVLALERGSVDEYLDRDLPGINGFTDPYLVACVRKYRHKLTGEITLDDLRALERLYASRQGIESLAGLEHCTSLRNLQLDNNVINDISSLKGLTNLTEIDLSNNRINDIHALAALIEIQELSLHRNNISNIDSLGGLVKMRRLWLGNNKISDISALSELVNLETLSLSNNQITDISPLAKLTGLIHLELGDNQIKDISHLAKLTELNQLILSDNQIEDITPLLSLTKLRQVILWDNKLNTQSGSPAKKVIDELKSRGCHVSY